MSFQTYPQCKEAVAPSIGDIPQHWNAIPLKRTLIENLTYGANEAAEAVNLEWPRFIRITDIDESGNLRDDTFRSLPPDVAQNYLLEDGDVLLARSGATVGKSFLYRSAMGACCFAGYLIRARPNQGIVCSPFLYWVLQSDHYWQHIIGETITATIQNVSAERYSGLVVPLPPAIEQYTIASFLDSETSKINSLISEQSRLIELLKEKRQAVISRAVTKGLDSNAPMRDSGIEWLGEVPEHWEVKRIKHLVEPLNGIQMGPFGGMLLDLSSYDTGFKVFGQENTISGDFALGSRWLPYSRFEELKRYELRSGDVVLTRKGSLGSARLVDRLPSPGIIDSDTIRLRTANTVMASALLTFLMHEAHYVETQIGTMKRGAILAGLNSESVANIFILTPPRAEQDKLLNWILNRCEEFDALIASSESAIALLRERRSALISAAVTGKIDVRNLVPKQSEAA